MDDAIKKIQLQLLESLENVVLKAIDAYGLQFSKYENGSLSDPLLRWGDFTLRYIPQTKREIFKSKQFPYFFNENINKGVFFLENCLLNGQDINSFQSKTLTKFNDTSGKNRRKRTDLLWADWGIHHLHIPLSFQMSDEFYSERSGWLLFLKIYNDCALLIDIKKHSDIDLFSSKDLVEKYIRSWPLDAERFEMKGVLGLSNENGFSAEETKILREHGVCTSLSVDGKIYASPGLGITTASTPAIVSHYRNKVYRYLRYISKLLADDSGDFQQNLKKRKVKFEQFKVVIIPNGDLGIWETKSNVCWKLPRNIPENVFSLFHDAVMPSWLKSKLASD